MGHGGCPPILTVILTRLMLTNVRNYTSLEFVPAAGLNVLVGANAQGKSNLLEAIGLLGTGKSYRTSRENEVITSGLPTATVAGEARVKPGPIRLSCTIALGAGGTRKRYTINSRAVRYASYLGKLRVVTFIPGHLQLVTGPPALRRSLLNAALSQESAAYYAALASYGKNLAQKNALLRGLIGADERLLATYNERLIESGTVLILARRSFVAELDSRARAIHHGWVGGAEGDLELRYAPSVPPEVPTRDAVAAAFATRLEAQRAAEFTRKTSLVGPHRDDVEFRLGGKPLAAFGSQGQQRSAILALKVAEYETLFAYGGEAPILLLDDVLSELDFERRAAFLRGVASVEQAFVTTTSDVEAAGATIYRIAAARLERVA
jgi:DNA replication and repair protein RecF